MVFWICISIGILSAFLASRKEFPSVWVALFNLIVAIYISLAVTASLGKSSPEAFESSVARMAMFLGSAILIFIIAQFLAKSFVLHGMKLTLPINFVRFANVILGFLMGYFLIGSVLFVVFISPAQSFSAIEKMNEDERFIRSIEKPVLFACALADAATFQKNGEEFRNVLSWMRGEVVEPASPLTIGEAE